MAGGYRGRLFVLAFDHRTSLQAKLFGTVRRPTREQAEKMSASKRLIFDGFRLSLEHGVSRASASVLVDEEFGAQVAHEAKERGFIFAMPVERSGQDEFDFEYGSDFARHIKRFDPTFCKALVRYNPEGDRALNRAQAQRLRALSDWVAEHDRKLMVELLVPADARQLRSVGEDPDRYDRELRPGLMRSAIEQLHDAGIEPDVWKLEGLETRRDCQSIAELARSGHRDDVACVVLGRGAGGREVEHWLRQAAGVPGFAGFAIGRTLWWDPLRSHLDRAIEWDEAAERISNAYRRLVEVYSSAALGVRATGGAGP